MELVQKDPPRAMSLAESLSPYTGPVVEGVDTSTVHRKVMCGYQGWFMAKGDGYVPGFVHWNGGGGRIDGTPPRCSVDFWPDMSELGPNERFATTYRHADGSTAYVFSSTVKTTVLRHFKWMKDAGIDGVFVQRFTGCVSNQKDWNYRRTCEVLNHCREGANRYGRAYAVMYDTDFDRRAVDVMTADWKRLVGEMKLMATRAYIRHRGAPVISLWGYGFGHRKFDAAATAEFFEFLKRPENGGCTIMLGVPNDWASWTDDRMRLLKKYATIISPWNVGRYGSPDGAQNHFAKHFPGDLALCKKHDKDYYAVVFPGFSWANMHEGGSPLNQTPRLGGRFLWRQFELVREYGMDMAYIAMFDEVDEGTAIFKCTNNPPVGRFCTYEGLPSDFYLTLCGRGGRLLRGEDVAFPEVAPDPAQLTYKPQTILAYHKKASPFDAAQTDELKRAFERTPIMVVGTESTCSTWLLDMNNSGLFDLREKTWDEFAREETPSPKTFPMIVFGNGTEDIGVASDDAAAAVADRIRAYVRAGGTFVVMSGGRYPMYRPGGGRYATQAGLRIAFIDAPRGSEIVFPDAGDLKSFKPRNGVGARVTRRKLYAAEVAYRSCAEIRNPAGDVVGDAVAVIGPGGELGSGRIVNVATDLQGYRRRAALLARILRIARAGK